MCGIAGFCNFAGDKVENLEKMKMKILHRGPDGGGSFFSKDGRVALGHRRLSILDLSEKGSQPMVSHSGRFAIAYNGEIYNHKEIAEKLLAEKRVDGFRGTSDTEVLLEAFETYGVEEAIGMCRGMFAIALYDQKEKVIYLLRDRVGEKPLYYGIVNGSFVFASDVGCFSVLDGFSNPVNREVLDLYFLHGYIPAPYSIYEKIWKLQPGCILKLPVPYDTWEIRSYWSMKEAARYGQQNLFTGSREEAADELERLLKRSITGQMEADVPVGAFLSAGIDSSTVVALMQSLYPGRVKSFTIGMEDEKYNEAVYAKEIARLLGTEHTELMISSRDAMEVIPKLAGMFGEPFGDSSQIPTYLVSRMTREHVTVSLSGDGGDELFCGYRSYQSVDRIWGKMKKIPYVIRKPASNLVLGSPLKKKEIYEVKARYLRAKGPAALYGLMPKVEQPLAGKISLSHGRCSYVHSEYEEGFLDEANHNIMLMDMLMYHPDDILVKVDRMAMANSLETRVPLLDKDVLEFAWTLPISLKRGDGTGKQVLRDVLYRYVPKELMERPKKGFSVPIGKWLAQPGLRDWAEELIEPERLKRQGFLDSRIVQRIWEDFTDKKIWRPQVWYILMFQQWLCEAGKG